LKRILALIATFALSSPSLGNQIFVVATNTSVETLEGGLKRTETLGRIRDFRLSLSVVAGRKGLPLEAISGTVNDTAFHVDLTDFPEIEGVRPNDISVSADCCIFGAHFYWKIPYGEATRCSIDTPRGRRRGRARKDIRIEVNGEGKVENVRIHDLCIR
jgi:hypothetical protein